MIASVSALDRLRTAVLAHLSDDPARAPLAGVGVFHCHRPQHLRDVPIRQPVMILVTGGRKTVVLGERRIEVPPGEMVLLPGGCTVYVGNRPADDGAPYLGLAMGFPEASVEEFRRLYGAEVPEERASRCHGPAPETVVTAMAQWVDWCLTQPVDPALTRHRQVEMLLLLARAGLAGHLLPHRDAGWADRVAQLVGLDPAREWSATLVSRRLNVGESTLRRHLKAEGTGLRKVLEETRLTAGLALLQETAWTVGRVADAVGYASHSRFSERFKRRFGLTPADLKESRRAEAGNS